MGSRYIDPFAEGSGDFFHPPHRCLQVVHGGVPPRTHFCATGLVLEVLRTVYPVMLAIPHQRVNCTIGDGVVHTCLIGATVPFRIYRFWASSLTLTHPPRFDAPLPVLHHLSMRLAAQRTFFGALGVPHLSPFALRQPLPTCPALPPFVHHIPQQPYQHSAQYQLCNFVNDIPHTPVSMLSSAPTPLHSTNFAPPASIFFFHPFPTP
jgi:hypothetical protein